MNKKLIAVAVAAGLALPMTAANAVDVADKKLEVYGKLHMSVGQYDENGTANDNVRLNSIDSRLGFKGQQKLDAGLTGTYKFEFGVAAVEQSGTNESGITRRNMYAGLKGGFGEVRVGRHDSPLKLAQGKFDQFGDTVGDLKYAGSQDGENRHDNSITYLGKFDKIGFNVQVSPGEGDGTDGGKGKGLTDSTSIAVTYTDGPLYIAAAADSHDKKAVVSSKENTMSRLVATYKFSDMQIGALVQSGVEKTQASATSKEDWMGLSFNMKIGSNNKLKAQYITVKDNASPKLEAIHSSIGIDHKLGKKGTLYAMYNTLDKTDDTKDTSAFSVGYVLKF